MSQGTRPAGWSAGSRFWWISAAAVLGIAATTALGCWQLDRAAQKKALAGAIDARGQQPPLDSQALLQALQRSDASQSLVHRSVQLQGKWLAQHTVYLENRQMHGRPGFFVFTPLQIKDEGAKQTALLVQRGWLPRNFQDRTALAPVDSPAGWVTVTGRLALSPARLYEWTSGADLVPAPSPIRQNLDLASYRAEIGLDLLDMTVVQTGAASEGLQRDWPRVDLGVDKHYGYAFQWFGLSVLIAILYVWFQFLRRFIGARQSRNA